MTDPSVIMIPLACFMLLLGLCLMGIGPLVRGVSGISAVLFGVTMAGFAIWVLSLYTTGNLAPALTKISLFLTTLLAIHVARGKVDGLTRDPVESRNLRLMVTALLSVSGIAAGVWLGVVATSYQLNLFGMAIQIGG